MVQEMSHGDLASIQLQTVNLGEITPFWGFPGGTNGKEPACQYRRPKRPGFHHWIGKIPWKTARQPSPVFLPGESHGQRSLAGFSPWGCKESDTTEMT